MLPGMGRSGFLFGVLGILSTGWAEALSPFLWTGALLPEGGPVPPCCFPAPGSKLPKSQEFEACGCCGIRGGSGTPGPAQGTVWSRCPRGVGGWGDGQTDVEMDGGWTGGMMDGWLCGWMGGQVAGWLHAGPSTHQVYRSAICCPERGVLDMVCRRCGFGHTCPQCGWLDRLSGQPSQSPRPRKWQSVLGGETWPCRLSGVPRPKGRLCGHWFGKPWEPSVAWILGKWGCGWVAMLSLGLPGCRV